MGRRAMRAIESFGDVHVTLDMVIALQIFIDLLDYFHHILTFYEFDSIIPQHYRKTRFFTGGTVPVFTSILNFSVFSENGRIFHFTG